MPTLDPKLKREVADRIRRGMSRPQIAKELNIKVGSVKHIAETSGLVTYKRMTIEEKKRVRVMFGEGIPVSEIALIVGKSVSSINNLLDRAKKSSYKCDEVVRLHKLKIGNKSIAHLLEITEANVRMVLRRRGYAKPRMTDQEVDKILEMAKKGMKTKDISEIVNRPITTIQAYLRRNGLARKVGNHNKPSKTPFKWDLPRAQ